MFLSPLLALAEQTSCVQVRKADFLIVFIQHSVRCSFVGIMSGPLSLQGTHSSSAATQWTWWWLSEIIIAKANAGNGGSIRTKSGSLEASSTTR